MEDAQLYDTVTLFAERRKKIEEQDPDTLSVVDCQVISIKALREQHEVIEQIVDHSTSTIATLLKINGHTDEADDFQDLARQLARSGMLTGQICKILEDLFRDAHPYLYKLYGNNKR